MKDLDRLVRALADAGARVDTIAAHLNISPSSVRRSLGRTWGSQPEPELGPTVTPKPAGRPPYRLPHIDDSTKGPRMSDLIRARNRHGIVTWQKRDTT